MKRFLKGALLSAALGFPAISLAANQTSFTYTGLYKSLKTSKDSAFSQLNLDFLLLETGSNKLCPTKKVMLGDGELTYQVLMSDEGALLLPLNKTLKKDHAAITFNTPPTIKCHLSMQIKVAEFELDTLSIENIQSWGNQFEALYKKLAGWPGRYFMPSVTGMTFITNLNTVTLQVVNDDKVYRTFEVNNASIFISRDELAALPVGSMFRINGGLKKVLPTLEK